MTAVSINDVLFGSSNTTKSPEEDFYQILGCSIHSNKSQITTEYRKKALEYHPDKSSSEENRRKFELLQE